MTAADRERDRDRDRDSKKKKNRRNTWLALGLLVAVVGLIGYQLAGLLALTRADSVAPTMSDAGVAELRAPDLDAAARAGLATYSNIYKYDYVGPETCSKCHARNYELWRSHPHSKMNRNASASTVVGDFDGSILDYADGRVVFSKVRGEYTMNLFRRQPQSQQSQQQAQQDPKFVRQLKVTRVIGSRFVQMYVGVQTEGPEPRDDAVYTNEEKLPFAFWISRKEWFPQTYDETKAGSEYNAKGELTEGYAFLGKPTTGGSSWKQVCIKCHNTYPYASRFEAAADGKLIGFPESDVKRKGVEPVNRLIPLEPWELVTLGISCESCHFGGREHALEGAAISFVPRSPDLDFPKATPELVAAGRHSSYAVNSICRQCHTADPQGPIYPNGAASWNSREAQDLGVGACASKIACTHCHNPHEAGPVPGVGSWVSAKDSGAGVTDVIGDRPDQEKHIGACVQCHQQYRSADAASKHSAHASNVKVTCLDCHMPKIVHGLSGTIRSHRISSPTDPKMLEGEYPNACNLCHLDRSTRWTLDALAAHWSSKKVDAVVVKDASNDPLGPRWLAHKDPVVRQVAASAYGRSPLGAAALPSVATILNDDSPPARMFCVLAVERILGRPIKVSEYTPWARPAVREEQVRELLRR